MRRAVICIAALFFVLPAKLVEAQGLEANIIELDIQPLRDQSNSSPLLIAAYQPQDSVPTLRSLGASNRSAVLSSSGKPTPSIIIGSISPGEETSFGIEELLPASVSASSFSYNDLAAREGLRNTDPELFRKLVAGGFIDPPEEQLVEALQRELARMNCYRSGIDGDWGKGSQRSVTAYFAALGNVVSWNGTQPTNELFREILLQGDARCVVASLPRTQQGSTTNRSQRNTNNASQRRIQNQQRNRASSAPARPAPEANQNKSKKSDNGSRRGGISGVFR